MLAAWRRAHVTRGCAQETCLHACLAAAGTRADGQLRSSAQCQPIKDPLTMLEHRRTVAKGAGSLAVGAVGRGRADPVAVGRAAVPAAAQEVGGGLGRGHLKGAGWYAHGLLIWPPVAGQHAVALGGLSARAQDAGKAHKADGGGQVVQRLAQVGDGALGPRAPVAGRPPAVAGRWGDGPRADLQPLCRTMAAWLAAGMHLGAEQRPCEGTSQACFSGMWHVLRRACLHRNDPGVRLLQRRRLSSGNIHSKSASVCQGVDARLDNWPHLFCMGRGTGPQPRQVAPAGPGG